MAITDYSKATKLEPRLAGAYSFRADARAVKQQYEMAINDFGEVIRLNPQDASAFNARAWIWATCPDQKYRAGKKAVESATRACELTAWKVALFVDTLAAACAENGDFAAAIKWQEKALALLTEAEEPVRKDLESRLTRFKAGQPFHEEPTPGPKGAESGRTSQP